jgi:hypothetical protein
MVERKLENFIRVLESEELNNSHIFMFENNELNILDIYNNERFKKAIGKVILDENLPDFVIKYCRDILRLGKVPEEWKSKINEQISIIGYPPFFAEDWCTQLLNNGKAPEIWIRTINNYILDGTYGYEIPKWAHYWCSIELERKNPKEWIEMINESIINRRKVPDFAREWYKKQNKLQDGTVAFDVMGRKSIKKKELIEAKKIRRTK